MPTPNVKISNIHVLAPIPPRTPAERAFADAFAKIAPSLPGSGWVTKLRADAMRAFEASGLPTRRIEAFKYTDLRERLKEAYPPTTTTASNVDAAIGKAAVDRALGPLATLDAARIIILDGVYSAELSDMSSLSGAVEFMALAPLLAKAPAWLEGKFAPGRLGDTNALTSLNTAFMSDGILLKVKPGQHAAKPVLLVHARSNAMAQSTATRTIVAIEAGASLTLIEITIALTGAANSGLTNTLSDVTVADGGNLQHVACINGDTGAAHMSSWIAKVGADAVYRAFQLTAGPRLARNNLLVEMTGERSRLDISGAFLARGTSHIDTTLVVDHKVANCVSRELFKGVLDDRARGVFQGKIIVRPGADKTDGKQMARALLLSEDTEFDSKPELEIYADDVACGHGATAAALDDDLMFYCRSRGIPENEARGLLIEAFIGDAIDKIENADLREAFMTIARDWLMAGSAPASGGTK
jgi:Fe-S cluster assembly protein SufD